VLADRQVQPSGKPAACAGQQRQSGDSPLSAAGILAGPRAPGEKSFLPVGLKRFQRRAQEGSLLIREASLREISTQQVGRAVATITGETVSAQTVSKLTRDLDEAVRRFHQARLDDDYVYLFLDGVSLRVRRPTGRKRVQMLVAFGIRQTGSRLAGLSAQPVSPTQLLSWPP